MRRKNWFLLMVILFSLWVAWPLLTPGFIPTHDGEYHFIRFWQFDKNIKEGILFPRWAPDLNSGLGVPLFNFFYPFPNYVAEFFHLLGFSFVEAFKLALATGVVMGAVFFYLWLTAVFSSWSGLVGAVFYTLAPYHLVDVYVRGSIGEVWALVWLPAVLWILTKLRKRPQDKVLLFGGSLFWALLILSHNILALVFSFFLMSYLIFLISTLPSQKRLVLVHSYLGLIFLGFGLASYFWLPALIESKYVRGLRIINFADHFPAFFQLILPSWGTGFSVPGVLDQMSFQIGLAHLLVVFLSCWQLRKKKKSNKKWGLFFLIWLVIVIFFLLEISLPFWRLFSPMALIQYPWRLLSLVIVLISFLAGLIVARQRFWWGGVLIFLVLLSYGSYTHPVKYSPRSDDFYLNNPQWTQGTATLGNSFNTIWLKNRPKNDKKRIIFTQKECRVKNLFKKVIKVEFQANCPTKTKVQLRIAYFPGWQVLIDDQKTTIDYQSNGLINFVIPAGEHLIEARLTNAPLRCLANSLSLLSLLFLIGGIILKRK